MRTPEEMMELILRRAREDERIRAVTMEGSRAHAGSVRDAYSDFDICYFVSDIRAFTKDPSWVEYFGEMLIMQCPDDWFDQPYDYGGHEKFTYLMQFADGNRIDLTLIDIRNIENERLNRQPRTVLLNKDHFDALTAHSDGSCFFIRRPTEKEYADTCNEFRWLSLYAAKGVCRRELYYAKRCYDVLMMPMFIQMLNWKIGAAHHFAVSTGSNCKSFKKFLSESEMEQFQGLFPNGEFTDIEKKLPLFYDAFARHAAEVAQQLNFHFDADETQRVRAFLLRRLRSSSARAGERAASATPV